MLAKIVEAQRLRVRIELPDADDIHFDFGTNFSPDLREQSLSNFLLRATFGAAMRRGEDLEVDIPVDGRLARNLHHFSIAWNQYRPKLFSKVSKVISPSYIDFSRNSSHYFTAAFSGGFDSSYMIASKSNAGAPYPSINRAVIIDGFGYDIGNKTAFNKAYSLGSKFLSGLNVSLDSVETNWKNVVGLYEIFHTMGISAVLGLKSNNASGAYIGLDFAAVEEFRLGPWGNVAGNNRLFSSSDFEVFPTGDDMKRIEKIKYLRERDLDYHIVVCNEFDRQALNCGTCEKCIRTQLSYRALGATPREGQFGAPLTKEAVLEVKIKKRTQLIFYTSIAQKWINRNDPYFWAVKKILANSTVN